MPIERDRSARAGGVAEICLHMATYTWNGLSGSFTDGSGWTASGGIVLTGSTPSATDDVVLSAGGYTLVMPQSQPLTGHAIEVASLTVQAGRTGAPVIAGTSTALLDDGNLVDAGGTYALTGVRTYGHMALAPAAGLRVMGIVRESGTLTVSGFLAANAVIGTGTALVTGELDVDAAGVSTLPVGLANTGTLGIQAEAGNFLFGGLISGLSGKAGIAIQGGTITGYTATDNGNGTAGLSIRYATGSAAGSITFRVAESAIASRHFVATNSNTAVFNPIVEGVFSEQAACFAGGTMLETPGGARPVESLRVGDEILSLGMASGVARAPAATQVRWIGHRRVAAHSGASFAPVRIRAGAFGADLPVRDLRLSGEHAVLVAPSPEAACVLVPVRHLVDGCGIVREPEVAVTYYHIELDRHDVVLAEGLPCESWLDTGNRQMFENAPATSLFPVFSADPASVAWANAACAPLVTFGPILRTVRARLAAQALTAGLAKMTSDPGLRVIAGGCAIPGFMIAPSVWRFDLPGRSPCARLLSHHVLPANDGEGDRRRLGICVTALRIDDAPVPLDNPALHSGWHSVERNCDGAWRWMDGDASLPGSVSSLEVTVGATLVYVVPAEPEILPSAYQRRVQNRP